MASNEDRLKKEKERIRKYLNPSIQGPNTDAILEALATGACHLIENVEAVNDSLYIATAQGRFLDARLADRNITRPDNVGLSDDTFREIGIEVSNRKQVRDLLSEILRIMYGEEFTRATMNSTELETYALQDGDTLIIQFDDQDPVEVTFSTNQFQSIAAATAQEVADAITRESRRLGRTGSAIARACRRFPAARLYHLSRLRARLILQVASSQRHRGHRYRLPGLHPLPSMAPPPCYPSCHGRRPGPARRGRCVDNDRF